MTNDLIPLLADASVAQIATLIRTREISSLQVTRACLARIEQFDHIYRAYTTVLRRRALKAARKSDAEVREGQEPGSLHGVPVNVKDAFLMSGTPTTVGSDLLRHFSPRNTEDAMCVQQLRRSGAVILGKVGIGSGMTAADPDQTRLEAPRNPWDPERTPGGSSSGSAVSVALGMGYASVGTDLGGSIRIPAAMSGVVGLKPTYGLISQDGDVFGLCSRLDHVGPITRTVTDAAILLQALKGADSQGGIFSSANSLGFLETPEKVWQKTIRIGWVSNGGPSGTESDVLTCAESGVRLLSDLGAIIEEVDLPAFSEELWYRIVLLDEWEAYDARTGKERGYLRYIKARLRRNRQRMLDQVLKEVALVRDEYRKLLERFDLLALPTTPVAAKPFDVRKVMLKGQERDVLDLFIVNTWMFNVTGHPAISLPCGFNREGLPVGLQLAGRHFDEELLLSVAAGFERAVGGFRLPRPSLDRVR